MIAKRVVDVDMMMDLMGCGRHPDLHIGRISTFMNQIYILHSQECINSGIDLLECEYSKVLDLTTNKLPLDKTVYVNIDRDGLAFVGYVRA